MRCFHLAWKPIGLSDTQDSYKSHRAVLSLGDAEAGIHFPTLNKLQVWASMKGEVGGLEA